MSLRETGEVHAKGPPLGRDAILRTMDNCTKCGLCQVHCPVAAVTDRFPGPRYSGPQAQRFRVIEAVKESAPLLCSGCGVCASVCPNDVAIPDIIAIAKAEMAGGGGALPLGQRLVNRPDLVGRLAGWWPGLANRLLAGSGPRGLVERLTGIDRRAPLPRIHGPVFRRWLKRRRQPDGPRVAYFAGCAVESYEPGVGIAFVEVLNHLGQRVEAPAKGCCALPMLSSGEWTPAAGRARRLIEALAPAARDGRPVLATSTSCGLTLKSKYAAYLDFTDDAALSVAASVRDICEFLRDGPMDKLAKDLQPLPRRALYHGPCQLRGHRMGQPAVEILRRVPGLDLTLSEAACCGVGGTYGYDRDKRAISEAVGAPLVDQVARARPDFVVCDSETCRWSIEAATGKPCLHPVEVLAASLSGRPDVSA